MSFLSSLKGMARPSGDGPSLNPMEALSALPNLIASLSNLPAAPVILGAFSRLVSNAITAEMIARGPSPAFLAYCTEMGIGDDEARALHAVLVAEVGA